MSDLTRWNRSGLQRFRYVNGNAVEFLETLRREFAERLPDWNPLDNPPPPVPDPDGEEPPRARDREIWAERREERLQKLYARVTGDLGWEIARTFARACHVLAEHVDAFANEGYLETATQWESVRRLVSLLDYHPAPPASATTYLVLKAKPDSAGRIEAGFAVESVGESVGSQVVFETLEAIDIDSMLDELKPAGAEVSPKTFDEAGDVPWFGPRKQVVRADQPVLINCVNQVTGDITTAAATVKNVSVENGQRRIELDPGAAGLGSCVLGSTSLAVSPSWDRAPRLNGPDVWFGYFDPEDNPLSPRDELAERWRPHGLQARDDLVTGDIVAWKEIESLEDAVATNWTFAEVMENDRWGIRFSKDPPDRSPVYIYQAVEVSRTGPVKQADGSTADGLVEVLLPPFKVAGRPDTALSTPIVAGSSEVTKVDVTGISLPLLSIAQVQIWGIPTPLGFRLPPPWDPSLIVEMAKMALGFFGSLDPVPEEPSDEPEWAVGGWPDDAAPRGDWDGGPRRGDEGNTHNFPTEAYRLAAGEPKTIYVVPELDQPPIVIEKPTRYVFDGGHGTLAEDQACVGRMGDDTYLALTIKKLKIKSDHFSVTFKERPYKEQLKHLYASFRGEFLPEGHDQNEEPIDWEECLPIDGAVVPEGRQLLLSDGENVYPVTATQCGENGIRVTPPPPAEIPINELTIHGNVVLAGHGERRPDRQLSGGPGGSVVRELLFEVLDVSFVSDSSQPGGVRADIEVRIDDELWEQVGSLRTSSPTDPHYTVRVTEEKQLMLGFGDGTYGRRLPSGTNNVNVRYRVGVGVAGNVAAGNLVRALERHPLVEEIFQFEAATGGNDAESVDDVRENGPQSVLTLDRAVSLDDFTHLATSHSSVWHARAFYTPAGDRLTDRVEVVVVPAGGGPLGDLKSELEEFLTIRAVPGVFVRVKEFFPIPLSLAVELSVDVERYEQQLVRTEVELALRDALSLENRGIGQALPISEVYRIVENVVGVANSRCRFLDETFATTDVSPDDEFVGARRTDVVYLDPDSGKLDISSERLTL